MNTNPFNWQPNELDNQLIKLAFQEDLGVAFADITTDILFPDNALISHAKVISKHTTPIVVCGLSIIPSLLSQFDAPIKVVSEYQDGDVIHPGQTLVCLEGPAKILLKLERTLLNFLQRLCAVATLTRQFTDKIKHTPARILDTRKTLPGFRCLDKYAVRCGGGVNHRMGLYDAIMVKDTHVDSLGGMSKTLALLPEEVLQKHQVIVEVRNIDELNIVLSQGLNKTSRVLLDNMNAEQLKQCVKLCHGQIATEASGNVDLDNVVQIAETGVDFISIGKITHSAGNVNLSMKCDI